MDRVLKKLGLPKARGKAANLLVDQYWAGDLLTDTISQEEYEQGTYKCRTANELLPIPEWRSVLLAEYKSKDNLPYALWVNAIARERGIEVATPVLVKDDFMNLPVDPPNMLSTAEKFCSSLDESYSSVVATIKSYGTISDEDIYRAIPVYMRRIGKPVIISDFTDYCSKLAEVYGDCELRWNV